MQERRQWVDFHHECISIQRQCQLLEVPRSSAYYVPNRSESAENLALMRSIDTQYLETPFYGVPRMTDSLREEGYIVNHKRVARLMRIMDIQAAMPGPHTSRPHPEHRIYPYLLRGMKICAPDKAWCSDITYIPIQGGFFFLVAVMDWYSRYVIAWELSNSLDTSFCVDVLQMALSQGTPEIFNTDQGSQFTSVAFTRTLLDAHVQISMDGRGRALDNVFIERLWRSVKYEDIYLRNYAGGRDLYDGLSRYFHFYNHERRHSSFDKQTPASVYKSR